MCVQSVVEQGFGEEAAQELLALVAVERLARLPVFDHFDAPEEARAPDVPHDGYVVQLFQSFLERNLPALVRYNNNSRHVRATKRWRVTSPPGCARAR